MRKTLILTLLAIAVPASVLLAATHNVSRAVTPAEAKAANALVPPMSNAHAGTFDEQVALILSVQDRVLAAAPIDKGIPQGEPRELPNLIRAGHGLCFDRSRAIETVLRSLGFETRHVSIYSTVDSGSALRSLAKPGTDSHAVTEVKTRRGWMLVDSNTRWAGLTADGAPLAMDAVRANPRRRWSSLVKAPLPAIYQAPFTWVYGLYSRHGRFYPPYDAVPDVNWAELAQNL